MSEAYFQDFMKENVCFGCGIHNEEGLKIKSYWDGDVAKCHWSPLNKYHGWSGLLNGGIMATLIDCHCMCTAMAYAYREEGRELDSQPEYRYATGTLNVKYLKPTPMKNEVELRAWVTEMKGRKVVLRCELLSAGQVTAEADVIAIRVYDSSEDKESVFKS